MFLGSLACKKSYEIKVLARRKATLKGTTAMVMMMMMVIIIITIIITLRMNKN